MSVSPSHASIEQIYDWLQTVKDPEIPTISVVELGIIRKVEIRANSEVFVEMVPTFSACPAAQFMRMEVEQVLRQHGLTNLVVELNQNAKWSSDDLTEKGREQLLAFGLAPPPRFVTQDPDTLLAEPAICPKCRSTNTELKNPFGPTLCRAIHHCNDCHETFEQFKPL